MTAETMETPVTENSDDLGAFEADFFNTPASEKEQPSDDVKPEDESEKEAPKEAEAEDDDPVDEEDEQEEAEQPKPKKKSAQERISELTAARKNAEQRAEELEKQLAALSKKDTPKDTKAETGPAEPSPDAVGEDGEPKYPLGEFDPQYIKDLTKFTLKAERDAMRQVEREENEKSQAETARTQLLDEWNGRVSEAETELPDFRTKAASLEETFSDLDPSYGEYLATTIMALDNGPEVLYYLANNIDEAKKIANMGPVRATIELGKIEGSLGKEAPKVKQSEAAPPPPRNRGGSVTTRTRGDTDDLNAFEKEFFKK